MSSGAKVRGHLARRDLLRGMGAGLLLPLLPGVAQADTIEDLPDPWREGSMLDRLVPEIDPVLDLTNAHTDERVAARFFDGDRYNRRAIREINWLFRDWREDESPQIDVRVFWGLAAISNAAQKDGHSGRITLLSGFRTKATNDMLRRTGHGAASNSFHLRARASDIRLAGIPMEVVATYADFLEIGGVGRYPSSDFVHVDSGPVRNWNG